MAETDVKVETTETEDTTEVETAAEDKTVAESPEVAKLKADIAKQKAALDKAMKEAADYKKQLRASKSAEEQRAEEERERQEATQQELEMLRKQFAVANITKSVMGFVGDETVSSSIAEALYGAADADAALDALNKAWGAKEKQLKIQYGKIPAPAAGDGAPQVSVTDLDKMTYLERLDFMKKYPDTYNKLMKR